MSAPTGTGTRVRCAAPWRGLDELTITPDAAGLRVTAIATVVATGNPYLAAHFPGLTILPGVFVLEAVQQAVRAAAGERYGRPPVLLELASARFLRPLRAAERMLLDVSVRAESDADLLRAAAQCRLAGPRRLVGQGDPVTRRLLAGPATATVRALFGWRR